MRKLTYLVAMTLDGVIGAAPHDAGDFFLLQGPHAEPQYREFPEMVPTHIRPHLGIEDAPNRHFDTVLQGRSTYEVGLREGVTNAYRHLRNIVFSTTMTKSPDPTVELVRADPIARVQALKREPGAGIWLCGGGRLAGTLRSEIDVIRLKLHPIVAGDGVRLFDGELAPDQWTLTEQRVWDNGVMLLTYVRATSESAARAR